MFGFKSAYFYLVAIQVTLIKFLKKLYFSSKHYNNSLKSKCGSDKLSFFRYEIDDNSIILL